MQFFDPYRVDLRRQRAEAALRIRSNADTALKTSLVPPPHTELWGLADKLKLPLRRFTKPTRRLNNNSNKDTSSNAKTEALTLGAIEKCYETALREKVTYWEQRRTKFDGQTAAPAPESKRSVTTTTTTGNAGAADSQDQYRRDLAAFCLFWEPWAQTKKRLAWLESYRKEHLTLFRDEQLKSLDAQYRAAKAARKKLAKEFVDIPVPTSVVVLFREHKRQVPLNFTAASKRSASEYDKSDDQGVQHACERVDQFAQRARALFLADVPTVDGEEVPSCVIVGGGRMLDHLPLDAFDFRRIREIRLLCLPPAQQQEQQRPRPGTPTLATAAPELKQPPHQQVGPDDDDAVDGKIVSNTVGASGSPRQTPLGTAAASAAERPTVASWSWSGRDSSDDL